MRYIFKAWLLAMMLANTAIAAEQVKEPIKEPETKPEPIAASFTLDAAISNALENSPRMQVSESVIHSAKAGLAQAGLLTNPSVGVDAENIAGNRDYSGVDSAEMTYGVSQLIEIGGKRDARKNIATRELDIAGSEYLSSGLNLIRDVTLAYNEAVAAQEALALAKEQRGLAGDVVKTITARVNEAASPLIHKSRAEVEYANSAITLDKAQKKYDLAIKSLLSLTGMKTAPATLDSSNFYAAREPAKVGEDNLQTNPDIKKLDLSLEKSKALEELEEANAIPDPSVNLGVRDFRESNSQALVLGFSIPIPVFNGNEGNIARAKSESVKVEAEKKQIELDYNIRLTTAESEKASSYLQIKTLKDEVTPAAEEAFKLAKQGYNLGRFSYIEVLDSQRSLFGVKEQYIESLKSYHAQSAEIERLTAINIDKIQTLRSKHD